MRKPPLASKPLGPAQFPAQAVVNIFCENKHAALFLRKLTGSSAARLAFARFAQVSLGSPILSPFFLAAADLWGSFPVLTEVVLGFRGHPGPISSVLQLLRLNGKTVPPRDQVLAIDHRPCTGPVVDD